MDARSFADLPNTLDPGRLGKMSEPVHRVLADLVHGCSPDPATRTVVVTTLVASLWQLAGRGMTLRIPSLILIDAPESKTGAAAMDAFAGSLVRVEPDAGPRLHTEGAFALREPAQAPGAMAQAVTCRKKIGKPTPYNREQIGMLENLFFDAQRTGFGSGSVRAYARVWHDAFGLLSERDGQLVLRLDGPEDRAAFRRHVLADPDRLRGPVGYGAGLELVNKDITVTGSLSPDQWDREMAEGLLALGLPFLFLPCPATGRPVVENEAALDFFTALLPKAFAAPLEEPVNLPPDETFLAYGRQLRQRLHHLPDAYEYGMQRAVRQLYVV